MKFIPFPSRAGMPWKVRALQFSPDSRILAAVERHDTWITSLSWWDVENQSPISDLPISDFACDVHEDAGYAPDPAISLDHRFLAYVFIERGPEYSLSFVDRSATKRSKKRERLLTALARVNHSSRGEYQALRFSPDGQFLITVIANEEGSEESERTAEPGIYRWSVKAILGGRGSKSEDHLLPASEFIPIPEPNVDQNSGLGRSLVFSPDGSILAAGLWCDRILRWEFPSGRELPELPMKKRRYPNAWRLAFSADSQTLAIADQSITLYESRTAVQRMVLPAHPISSRRDRDYNLNVYDLEFHPSAHLLATACGDSLVRWWDAKTGVEKETFDLEIGKVSAVAFSPDGCLCGAAGKKGLAIWDVSQ
jgi:WD40 repeat protein